MSGLNLLVFRGGQRRASGQDLKAVLTAQLERACSPCPHEAALAALLLAGELECGVADSDGEAVRRCEVLTDRIADSLLPVAAAHHPDFVNPDFQNILESARALPTLNEVNISIPEGFAYYALHPFAYANAMWEIPACESLLVVGIRSIGTTLSAMAAAAVRARGIAVERITVRPKGHPYNRNAEFTPEQMAAVGKAISCGASFAVVDEGPGLSGSSFLAVAEALEQAGAPVSKIMLIR